MSDLNQWHESRLPVDDQQVLVRTRHVPEGWNWEICIGETTHPGTGAVLATQEAAMSAALHEAAVQVRRHAPLTGDRS
ncbi:MAG: hypothetical protein RLZZ618_4296 [Pseudomonadota bacterium]|jgi:hypothetical protein